MLIHWITCVYLCRSCTLILVSQLPEQNICIILDILNIFGVDISKYQLESIQFMYISIIKMFWLKKYIQFFLFVTTFYNKHHIKILEGYEIHTHALKK